MAVPRLPSSFNIRDYLELLFPGLLFVAAIVIIYPDLITSLEKHPIFGALVAITGAYILGFISYQVFVSLFPTLLGKRGVEPFYFMVFDRKSFGEDKSSEEIIEKLFGDKYFAEMLQKKLKKVWGEDLFNNRIDHLVLLCWREIQMVGHGGIEYVIRMVTLLNMTISFVVPIIFLLGALIYQKFYVWAALSILIMIVMLVCRRVQRDEMVRNVLRIWYISHRDEP